MQDKLCKEWILLKSQLKLFFVSLELVFNYTECEPILVEYLIIFFVQCVGKLSTVSQIIRFDFSWIIWSFIDVRLQYRNFLISNEVINAEKTIAINDSIRAGISDFDGEGRLTSCLIWICKLCFNPDEIDAYFWSCCLFDYQLIVFWKILDEIW